MEQEKCLGVHAQKTRETTIHVQTVRVLANVQIMFKLIIAGGRDFNNYDGMSKCLDRLLKNINDNIEIVCGMARGADRLGERYAKEHGYRLALATSSRELHAQLLLKKYGLFDYFDGAVYGNMVSAGKPDPEIYLKACASIQVLPEFAIALEDAPSGIRSAAAAGMRPVMIPDLVEPDEAVLELVWRRFDTLYDVIDLLESDFQNS